MWSGNIDLIRYTMVFVGQNFNTGSCAMLVFVCRINRNHCGKSKWNILCKKSRHFISRVFYVTNIVSIQQQLLLDIAGFGVATSMSGRSNSVYGLVAAAPAVATTIINASSHCVKVWENSA